MPFLHLEQKVWLTSLCLDRLELLWVEYNHVYTLGISCMSHYLCTQFKFENHWLCLVILEIFSEAQRHICWLHIALMSTANVHLGLCVAFVSIVWFLNGWRDWWPLSYQFQFSRLQLVCLLVIHIFCRLVPVKTLLGAFLGIGGLLWEILRQIDLIRIQLLVSLLTLLVLVHLCDERVAMDHWETQPVLVLPTVPYILNTDVNQEDPVLTIYEDGTCLDWSFLVSVDINPQVPVKPVDLLLLPDADQRVLGRLQVHLWLLLA